MSDDEPSHALVNETIDLVKHRPVTKTLEQISKGSEVPIAWLSLFANSKIPKPNAHRVLRVYEFMTGKNIQDSLSKN